MEFFPGQLKTNTDQIHCSDFLQLLDDQVSLQSFVYPNIASKNLNVVCNSLNLCRDWMFSVSILTEYWLRV